MTLKERLDKQAEELAKQREEIDKAMRDLKDFRRRFLEQYPEFGKEQK